MALKNLITQLIVPLILITLVLVAFPVSAAAPAKRWKSSSVIKVINRKGPYIGLITVYAPEEQAFLQNGAFKPDPRHPYVDLSGRRFRVGKIENKRVIYVRCGIGMVNAAATTQQLLDMFNIVGIIHFGIAGNANDSMSIGDVTIPAKFVNTGLWDWLKPNGKLPNADFAELDIGKFNEPLKGINLLGSVGYAPEQFYSESGTPDIAQSLVWMDVSNEWLKLAANLEGMELEKCVNSSICLGKNPKVAVGLKGSTANSFLDNAAYRNFLFKTFHVSSLDMESAPVVMTSLSNGSPIIVIRGLSDLAGAQEGESHIGTFGSLAALNVVKVVTQFVNMLPAGNVAFHSTTRSI